MNKFLSLALVLTFLGESSVLGAQQFPAAKWAGIQTYEISALQKLDRLPVGQLVEIKFNYRHKRIRHLKSNWSQGSLWAHTPAAKEKFSFVQVMVAKDALPAFEAITPDFKAGGNFVAYGQILQDTEANKWRFVRLFGTKLERDAAGNATVSW